MLGTLLSRTEPALLGTLKEVPLSSASFLVTGASTPLTSSVGPLSRSWSVSSSFTGLLGDAEDEDLFRAVVDEGFDL